jgi:hypothetical protein
MSIQFRFHPEKAVEAAAVLLKCHQGQPMEYLGLLKMMYIADRRALEAIEQPITGDRYVSMKYGPVLSSIYDLVQGNSVVAKASQNENRALSVWSQFISSQGNNFVSLIRDPGSGHLCGEEERILRDVYREFGHIDPFEVAEWIHSLPEWQDPGASAIPILVEDVLRLVGKTDEEIYDIRQESLRESYLDEALHVGSSGKAMLINS